ncbi:MAG: S6e family ribosomal protein [Fervidicoccaceae archaeon]
MPEFKLVVSIPRSKAERAEVRLMADDSLKLDKSHREKRALPRALISPSLAERIGLSQGDVALIKIPSAEGKTAKHHVQVYLSDSLEEDLVKLPAALLIEATGGEEARGEIEPSRAFQLQLDDSKSRRLLGLKIGDEIDASLVGLRGKLVITGGSDSSGFPMRPDVPGGAKKRVLISQPPGFRPKKRGLRERRIVRGNTIVDDLVQVNAKLVLD